MSAPIAVGAIAAGGTPSWSGTPAGANQLTNKTYVDAGDALNLPLAGGTLTGGLTINTGGLTILGGGFTETGPVVLNGNTTFNGSALTISAATTPTWAGTPAAGNQLTTKTYVDGAVATSLPLAGGTLTGPLILAADPTVALGAATKQYVDNGLALYVPLAGGTMTGKLQMASGSTGIQVNGGGITIGNRGLTVNSGNAVINLNAASIQSSISGALLRIAQVDGQFCRMHLDSYGAGFSVIYHSTLCAGHRRGDDSGPIGRRAWTPHLHRVRRRRRLYDRRNNKQHPNSVSGD